jgi:hypothetical protein
MIKWSADDKSYEKLLLGNPYRQFWEALSDRHSAEEWDTQGYGHSPASVILEIKVRGGCSLRNRHHLKKRGVFMKSRLYFSILVLLLCLSYISCQTPSQEDLNTERLGPEVKAIPALRMYHSLIYHDRASLAVLLCGFTKHGWKMDLRDVWTCDPRSGPWKQIGTCSAVPEKGGFTAAVNNKKQNVIILLNITGETWAFQLESRSCRNMKQRPGPSDNQPCPQVPEKSAALAKATVGLCTSPPVRPPASSWPAPGREH